MKAKVIALLEEGISTRGEHYYRIPNAHVSCFPASANEDPQSITRGRHPSLFEVSDFEDPKVKETIENLRKLRGKHREEAEKNAGAKPATGSATPPAPPAPVSPAPPSRAPPPPPRSVNGAAF